MKKHALAIALIATAPALAQAEGPTLYGKLNVTLDSVENDTGVPATSTDVWSLNSNASRLGVKGDADTGIQGLKGLYYAEFGLKADDGVGPLTQRNIYAGLKGDFGTVRAGKIDSPLKDAQGKVDQFNDFAGDIQNLTGGETRVDNILYYSSPKFADSVVVNLAIAPGEGRDIDNSDNDATVTTNVEDGIADYLSASVVYEQGPLYAALAIAQNNTGSGNVDSYVDIDAGTAGTQSVADFVRFTAVYKADAFEAGFLYQTSEDVGDQVAPTGADAAWLLSGAYKNDKWKLKAQVGANEGDATGREKTLTAIGADFAAGKATTLFGYWTAVDTDNPGAAADTAVTTLGFGIDQKF